MEGERGFYPQSVAPKRGGQSTSSRRPVGGKRPSLFLAICMALAGGAVLAGAAMFCFVIFLRHAAAPSVAELARATQSSPVATSPATSQGEGLAAQPPTIKAPQAESTPASSIAAADAKSILAAASRADSDANRLPTAGAGTINRKPIVTELAVAPPPVQPVADDVIRGGAMPAAAVPGGGMPAVAAPGQAMPGQVMAAPAMPAAGAVPVGNARAKRRMLVLGEGGTAESERAVEAALVWLAEHQMTDGGWSFNHQLGGCAGRCPNPGNMAEARIGATAMALLPFLAAGYSYDEEGPYQQEIARGLVFLISHMAANGALWETGGTMYSHGLATLALCDAYNLGPKVEYSPGETGPGAAGQHGKAKLADERVARAEAAKLLKAAKAAMAKPHKGATNEEAASPGHASPKLKLDPGLLGAAAQAALDFIVGSQDPVGGGWRYQPHQPGDTSVVGWQIMALKAGQHAQLRVPAATLAAGERFLNIVQVDYGSGYGYTTNMRGTPATTAIGLLARMNLGWDRSHPGLAAGAQNLAMLGPSQEDMYFNFYATQVLRNFGGPLYERWNPLIRDFLVQSQNKEGHLQGSWQFAGGHGSPAGGRLYNTALCTLTLEVYYRYQPIYSAPSPAQSPGEIAGAEEAARRKRRLPAME